MRIFAYFASFLLGTLFVFSFFVTVSHATAPLTKPLLHDGAAFQPFADVFELKITSGDPGPHAKRKKHNPSGIDRVQRNQAHIRKNKARAAMKRA